MTHHESGLMVFTGTGIRYKKFDIMWKITCMFLLLTLNGLSQAIIPVATGDRPDALVLQPAFYDIETVWSYNNGADLIVEFGFNSLMVQEIVWGNERIRMEVYRMMSPEGAFGVYSLSVLNCTQRDTLCSYDCNKPFQYQAAYGNLYISISSESGSASTSRHFLPAAKALMQRNLQIGLELPEPFNSPLMKKGRKNLVYIQGQTALQNSLFPWQDLFLGVRFGMYAILLANPESEMYFARIRFETPDDKMRFLGFAGLMKGNVPVPNTNTNDGLYREFMQLDDLTIYFLQSQEPWPISAVIAPER